MTERKRKSIRTLPTLLKNSVNEEEALLAISMGYTPRYIEKCKAEVRRTGKKLDVLFPPREATWIQALAVRWDLTEKNSEG